MSANFWPMQLPAINFIIITKIKIFIAYVVYVDLRGPAENGTNANG